MPQPETWLGRFVLLRTVIYYNFLHSADNPTFQPHLNAAMMDRAACQNILHNPCCQLACALMRFLHNFDLASWPDILALCSVHSHRPQIPS